MTLDAYTRSYLEGMSHEAQSSNIDGLGGGSGDELLRLSHGLIFEFIQEAEEEFEFTSNL